MADYFDAKHGAVVAIPFGKANATTGEADTDLYVPGSAYGTLAAMPAAGSIIAVSGMANAAVTAGSITLRAHSNSTEEAETGYPAPVISSAAQASYATCAPGTIRFAAGDKLGISMTTTTTLDATDSLDVDALLFVVLDPI